MLDDVSNTQMRGGDPEDLGTVVPSGPRGRLGIRSYGEFVPKTENLHRTWVKELLCEKISYSQTENYAPFSHRFSSGAAAVPTPCPKRH